MNGVLRQACCLFLLVWLAIPAAAIGGASIGRGYNDLAFIVWGGLLLADLFVAALVTGCALAVLNVSGPRRLPLPGALAAWLSAAIFGPLGGSCALKWKWASLIGCLGFGGFCALLGALLVATPLSRPGTWEDDEEEEEEASVPIRQSAVGPPQTVCQYYDGG